MFPQAYTVDLCYDPHSKIHLEVKIEMRSTNLGYLNLQELFYLLHFDKEYSCH